MPCALSRLALVFGFVAIPLGCGGGDHQQSDGGATDAATDTLPRLACDWPKPTFVPGVRKDPLAVTPGVIRWQRVYGDDAGAWQAELVGFGDQLAIAAGYEVIAISRLDGATLWKRNVYAPARVSYPLWPSYDENGMLWVLVPGGVAKFDPSGVERWRLRFVPPADGEGAYGGEILLKGRYGIVGSSDNNTYVFDVVDNAVVAQLPHVQTWSSYYVGAGEAIVYQLGYAPKVRGIPDGKFWGTIEEPTDGTSLFVRMPMANGLMGKHILLDQGIPTESRLAKFDGCGNEEWEASPGQSREPRLIGFDDDIVANIFVTEFKDAGKKTEGLASAIAISDTHGAIKVESEDQAGTPIALGADGVIYASRCQGEYGAFRNCRMRALREDLTEIWNVPLGDVPVGDSPLGETQVVLTDDGMLYLPRLVSAGIEIIALQTTSPGLAPTAWPVKRRDNGGRAWLP